LAREGLGEFVQMRALSTFKHVYICREAVDGRKQINTLAVLVEADLGRSPLDGSLFVFVNRRRDTLKMLYYDRTGFALWCKRLESATFRWLKWPQTRGAAEISTRHLEMLLDGFDVFSTKPHEEKNYSRLS
jgi:transposase